MVKVNLNPIDDFEFDVICAECNDILNIQVVDNDDCITILVEPCLTCEMDRLEKELARENNSDES